MSQDTTQTRRRLLGAVGATGLALGVAGTAVADTDETVQSDDVTTQGEWEYRCSEYPCDQEGIDDARLRRYCSGGSCSGWEYAGCC